MLITGAVVPIVIGALVEIEPLFLVELPAPLLLATAVVCADPVNLYPKLLYDFLAFGTNMPPVATGVTVKDRMAISSANVTVIVFLSELSVLMLAF